MPDPGRARVAFCSLAGLIATAACGPAEIHNLHTLHTDSAGIPIVTAVAPLWEPDEAWKVDAEPVVEIGTVSGPLEYQFSDVVAAVRLSSGDIVVADRGASELRSYDAAGTFQWRAGRFGQGPGEFESLDFLGTTTGDSLVTYDEALMRVQLFYTGGRMARSFELRPQRFDPDPDGGSPSPEDLSGPDKTVGVVGRQLIVRFIELGDLRTSGVVRQVDDRVVAVALGNSSATGLIVVGGEEALLRGGRSQGQYAFGNMPEYGAAADRVAVIDTEAWSVRVLSPADGTIERIVRRDVAPREATDALFEEHLAGILAMFSSAPPEEVDRIRQMWRDFPRAPVLPVLRSIHVDATGHLWLQPYYVAGAEPPPFEIHAPDGTWLGSVSVPPGLVRAFIQYQAPYMEIGEDYILGVWTDELDVQYVRMYRINK
ncbi:MAG: hypothetical protein F4Z31_13170 [Gemmatimonadetes bacterium]|nr:hypothetical protein [Gemmatimonadota bacterium]MCY3678128.1 hypothetical protein [Gemmatimonadota bacterium]MYA42688.1 hypothetical protein [Gemmatimonadota bacterium]MYE94597.1 hypothetical protein [Gemmatimonadota bacterium]MYJ11590.1 hypothetical protein [Gemmatimonadota bacterium]